MVKSPNQKTWNLLINIFDLINNMKHQFAALLIVALAACEATELGTAMDDAQSPGNAVITDYVIDADEITILWAKTEGADAELWRTYHNGVLMCAAGLIAVDTDSQQTGSCSFDLVDGVNIIYVQMCNFSSDGASLCSVSDVLQLEHETIDTSNSPPGVISLDQLPDITSDDQLHVEWVKEEGINGNLWYIYHNSLSVCNGYLIPPSEQISQSAGCDVDLNFGEHQFQARLCIDKPIGMDDLCTDSEVYNLTNYFDSDRVLAIPVIEQLESSLPAWDTTINWSKDTQDGTGGDSWTFYQNDLVACTGALSANQYESSCTLDLQVGDNDIYVVLCTDLETYSGDTCVQSEAKIIDGFYPYALDPGEISMATIFITQTYEQNITVGWEINSGNGVTEWYVQHNDSAECLSTSSDYHTSGSCSVDLDLGLNAISVVGCNYGIDGNSSCSQSPVSSTERWELSGTLEITSPTEISTYTVEQILSWERTSGASAQSWFASVNGLDQCWDTALAAADEQSGQCDIALESGHNELQVRLCVVDSIGSSYCTYSSVNSIELLATIPDQAVITTESQTLDDDEITIEWSNSGIAASSWYLTNNGSEVGKCGPEIQSSVSPQSGSCSVILSEGVNAIAVILCNNNTAGSQSCSTSETITIDRQLDSPTFTSSKDIEIAENSTGVIYTPEVQDNDSSAEQLSFALLVTDDHSAFSLNSSSGEIAPLITLDYENPQDSNGDNVYLLQLEVYDETGSSSSLALQVSVSNINESSPQITSSTSADVIENDSGVFYIASAEDGDGDAISFSVAGSDAQFFSISSSGALAFASAPDYDNPSDSNGDNIYLLELIAADSAGARGSIDLDVSVIGFDDEAPVMAGVNNLIVEIDEVTGVIHTLSATDADLGIETIFTYSLSGVDAADFALGATSGELAFVIEPSIDAPKDDNGDNIYQTVVSISDASGNSNDFDFNISVISDLDVVPEFAVASVSIAVTENTSGIIYDANATADDTFGIVTYAISGIDASVFHIDSVSGELSFSNNPDFENPLDQNQDNNYEIEIIASNGANSSEQNLTVEVTNINDNTPDFAVVSITVVENNSDTFYTSVATDLDSGDAITYRLSGIDASAFDLNTTDGGLRFRDSPNFENPHDANSDNSYELEINASDGVNNSSQILTVAVTNVNEAPSASISISPDANSTTLTTATTVTLDGNASSDPDGDTLDYTWSQPSGQYVSLSSAIAPSTTFTANEAGTYTFTLTVSDREFFARAVATVTISSHLPSDFSAIAVNTRVTLTWSSHTSSTIYSIYRSSDPSCDQDNNYSTACSSSFGALFSGVAPGFIDTGLANGSTYYYWLEASLDGVTQRSSSPISATPWPTPLNDTGIDWAGNYESDNNSDCSSNMSAPQDCHHGRDATHNDDSDGRAGFSFTKLDSAGNPLAASATEWSCVQDNVTGLIWEVKTDDGGLHDTNDTYNWYNTDPTTNGGSVGYPDANGVTCHGYESSDSTTHCNTEAFVARVNAARLCGISDWRLPNQEELYSIVDYGHYGPSIDRDYFPNTASEYYWSAAPSDHLNEHSWIVHFYQGYDTNSHHDNSNHVRLVNSAYSANLSNDWSDQRYEIHDNGTVTDTYTGLMWMQCSLGQNYVDKTCSSSNDATKHNWQEALEISSSTSFAAYSDWRLPNIKELASLVARDRHEPSVNSIVFTNTPSSPSVDWYWSASPATNEYYPFAWRIYFSEGYNFDYYQSHSGYVRLVRYATPESNTSVAIGSAPEFSTDSASVEYAENSSGIIYDANASDADSDTLTYSIAGADSSLFVVDSASGALYFRTSPDREQPLDADTNNTYELSFIAEDPHGNQGQQSLTVVVTNVNDNFPEFNSLSLQLSIAENNTSVIDIIATDADGDIVTYYIYGDDADAFEYNSTAGVMWFKDPPDHENPQDINQDNSYELRVQARDGNGRTAEKSPTIEITNLNDNAPTAIISISPDPANTILTTATEVTLEASTSTDPDGDELNYTWSQPSDQSIFLNSLTTSSTTFIATAAGTYNFTLTVSDGEFSDSTEVNLNIHPITLPEDFAANAGDSEVTLTWSPYSTSTAYNIYRSTDPNCNLTNYLTACSASALFSSVAPGFADTNLTNATTYYYWIEAILNGVTQRSISPINATPWQYIPLNDTGIDWGGNYQSDNNSDCSSNIDAPQDCHQGRDATHNDDSDGHAGFSFTKLDSIGNPLAASAAEWSCVQDNVTGLIWEVKTDDGGLHDRDDKYIWYDTNPNNNDGKEGFSDYHGAICYGYDSSDANTYCNTEAFASRVNTAGLCGASDWRMPNAEEIISLLKYHYHDYPNTDTDYFPRTQTNKGYWSSSLHAEDTNFAVKLSFSDMFLSRDQRQGDYYVRLVRSINNGSVTNNWPGERYQIHGDGTVTDKQSGLVWMQCSLGQDSEDSCYGDADFYDWQEALEAADELDFANYSDWRLPNIKELASLVARDRYSPSINNTIFPNTLPDVYWSSSPRNWAYSSSWSIDLYDGYYRSDYRYSDRHVRLVRDTTSDTTDSNETAAPVMPSSPTILYATNNSIELNWSSVDAATYYQLFQNTSNNSSSANLIYQGSTTYTSQDNLDPNITYYYWLKACNSAGCSDFSQASSITTDDHGNTRSAATSIDLNSSISGTIEIEDDIDYFEVVLPHAGYLFIHIEAFLDTDAWLEESDGSILNDDYSIGTDNNMSMSNYLDAGTYYVRIDSYSDTGQYNIHIEFHHDIDDDHANTRADATSIDLNSSISGTIEVEDDIDYFEVVLPHAGYLFIDIEAFLDDTDARLEESDGSILSYDYSNGTDNNLSMSSYLDAGTYYVRVESYRDTGQYTLYVEFDYDIHGDHANIRADATSVDLNSSISGEIEIKDDIDYFEIVLPQSGDLTVYTEGSLDTYGWLEESNGSIIAENDDSGDITNFSISSYLDAGTYYIRVESFNNNYIGEYTLHTTFEARNNNQAPTAIISISPDPASTTITTATEVTLEANASIDPDGDELNYTWSQPNDQSIALSSTTNWYTTFTAAEPGTYNFTLSVSDGEFSDSAEIHIDIVEADTVNQSPTISIDANQSVQESDIVNLSANATDSDGTIESWHWTQLTGTPVNITNASSRNASFIAPEVSASSDYQFKFEAVDDQGAISSATTSITVQPIAASGLFGFGQRLVNTSYKRAFAITNSFAMATDFSFSFADNSDAVFSLSQNSVSLMPGQSEEITLTFAPVSNVKNYSDRLNILYSSDKYHHWYDIQASSVFEYGSSGIYQHQLIWDGQNGIDGLASASSVAVSNDGKQVFVTSQGDGALTIFDRDITTGTITYRDIFEDGVDGVDGLFSAMSVAISSDDTQIFVASDGNGALAIFDRNAQTGEITYRGAFKESGDSAIEELAGADFVTVAPDGTQVFVGSRWSPYGLVIFDRDTLTGEITYSGTFQEFFEDTYGLDGISSVALSSNSNQLFIASEHSNSLSILDRDADTGKLTYRDIFQDGINDIYGLEGPSSVAISPDDRQVFVTGEWSNSLVVFDRDANTGELTYRAIYEDGINDVDGLYNPTSVTVSSDGSQVFVTAISDNSLVIFDRDQSSGELMYRTMFKDGSDNIDGLGHALHVTTSLDGKQAFVAAPADGALTIFDRNTTSGDLTYRSMFKDGTSSSNNLDGNGLEWAKSVVVSPDGTQVFVAGISSLVIFERDITTSELSYQDIIEVYDIDRKGYNWSLNISRVAVSSDGTQLFTVDGSDSIMIVFDRNQTTGDVTYRSIFQDGVDNVDGLDGANSVAVSSDGTQIFVASEWEDDALVVFDRDASTGVVSYRNTFKDNVDGVDGLGGSYYVTSSADGKQVFVVGIEDDALAIFDRNASTGELTYRNSFSEGINGLDGARAVAVSADGTQVFVASLRDNALVVFDRNADTGELVHRNSFINGSSGVDGLDGAESVALSSDGTKVFVVGSSDGSLVIFDRNPNTKEVIYRETYKNGINGIQGLGSANSISVSLDGTAIFITGGDIDDSIFKGTLNVFRLPN